MRGFSFLITWLVFGIPSSAIAVGIGCFLHLSAITIAALVVAIEAMTVLSGVFCVAAKNADSDEIHVRGLRKERKQS